MTVQGKHPLPATEGDRVRFTVKPLTGETLTGEGTFSLCWFGVEEVWDVTLDDGQVVHVHPGLGETMESV